MTEDKPKYEGPRFDLKKLLAPTTKGGAQAELEYGQWHHQHGTNKLKRKYTEVQ
jgi:hypothetical protein